MICRDRKEIRHLAILKIEANYFEKYVKLRSQGPVSVKVRERSLPDGFAQGGKEILAGLDIHRLLCFLRHHFHEFGWQFADERGGVAGSRLAVFLSAEAMAHGQRFLGSRNRHVK